MGTERMTQEQIVSRGTVRAIRETDGRLTITLAGGLSFDFHPDPKLRYDISVAVQDYFRRTGRDYRRDGR